MILAWASPFNNVLFVYIARFMHIACRPIVVSVDPRGCVFHLNEWEIQPFAS